MPDERAATWDDLLAHEAKKQNVSFQLAKAMMDVESQGRPDAVSKRGAIGLMQLMPDTAKELGVDPRDPLQNIRGGVTYLRRMIDLHPNDLEGALRAYNAGPNAQNADQIPETRDYVQRVLARLQGTPAPRRESPVVAGHRAPISPSLQAKVPKIGGPPPAPPAPTHTEPPGLLKTMLLNVSPTTPEGRRNLGGGIGAIGGPMLATLAGAPLGPLGMATTGVLGAMITGG